MKRQEKLMADAIVQHLSHMPTDIAMRARSVAQYLREYAAALERDTEAQAEMPTEATIPAAGEATKDAALAKEKLAADAGWPWAKTSPVRPDGDDELLRAKYDRLWGENYRMRGTLASCAAFFDDNLSVLGRLVRDLADLSRDMRHVLDFDRAPRVEGETLPAVRSPEIPERLRFLRLRVDNGQAFILDQGERIAFRFDGGAGGYVYQPPGQEGSGAGDASMACDSAEQHKRRVPRYEPDCE